ncbi:MAG: nitroreductase family protein [Bacteroidales bacterium]|nr:nitroreductase family protein [Bacteroidales bacterium]
MNREALENMKERRSCRSFSSEVPPRELIAAVCEAGTYAPTGHGKQSPLILAVTNKELRDRLSAMNARIWNELALQRGENPKGDIDPFYGAPVVLVVLADRTIRTAEYDGCSVICQLVNAAHAVGLGSCWIHRAKEEFESEEGKAILRELGVEGDYVGVGHCILGYPTKEPSRVLPRKRDYVRWVE